MKSKLLSASFVLLLGLIGQVCNAEESSKYYGGNLCAYPEFTCISIKPSDTWAKLFPNERDREIVKRLNRTNVALQYRTWIVIPRHLKEITHMDLSPFPDQINTGGEKMVLINLGLQAFAAYGPDGGLVHWGPVSAGRGWCKDINASCTTATGSFRITNKKGPECVSDRFPVETGGGAPMPYCMYFYRGFAMHGSTLPGFHASHGCVRLFFDDAEWLNKYFVDIGTKVIVTN